MAAKKDEVSLRRMFELEMELDRLRKENGIEEKAPLWVRAGDWLVSHLREPRKVSRKKYLALAIGCGWLCGAHQFYAGHKLYGILYLLFCWTGISLAMTLIDVLLILLRYEPDENGMVLL